MLADLGCSELACPAERYLKLPPDQTVVPICTPQYRAPDMILGNVLFGPDLDLWSLGCVAAELFLREPLFPLTGGVVSLPELGLVDLHFQFLGSPPRGTRTHAWMKSLPFVRQLFGQDDLPEVAAPPEWPPERLQGCPPQLADFVRELLRWHPRERRTAASAKLHSFLMSSPCLSVPVAGVLGKNGLGSIAEGFLDDDVLEYLQNCPTWEEWHEECRRTNFEPNCCISEKEGKLRMKREFAGYIDANNPPQVQEPQRRRENSTYQVQAPAICC